MSLIALQNRLRAGRAMTRTLLLLLTVTGAVIVGLLAMHSLNTHTAAADTSHHATEPVAAAAAAGDHHTDDAAAGQPCLDCGGGHADMLTMACVLALLITMLLVVRPVPGHRSFAALARPQPTLRVSLPQPGLGPPSLTALCISRT